MKRFNNYVRVAIGATIRGNVNEDDVIFGIQVMGKDVAWTYFFRGLYVGMILMFIILFFAV